MLEEHFILSQNELTLIQQWKESLPEPISDVYGSDYCYEYVCYPTGLGIIRLVRRMDGHELDLTDYDKF